MCCVRVLVSRAPLPRDDCSRVLIGSSLLLRYDGDVDYEYRPEIISVLQTPRSRSEQGSEESRREFESSAKGRETTERKGAGSYFANRCLSKGSKEWNLKEKEQRIVESIDRRTVKEGLFPRYLFLSYSLLLFLSLTLCLSLFLLLSLCVSDPKMIFAHSDREDAEARKPNRSKNSRCYKESRK